VRRAALAGVLPRPRPHQLPELQAYAGMPYPAGLAADLSGGARNADPEADPHRDPQRPVLKPAAAPAGANTTQKEPCPDGQGFFYAWRKSATRGGAPGLFRPVFQLQLRHAGKLA